MHLVRFVRPKTIDRIHQPIHAMPSASSGAIPSHQDNIRRVRFRCFSIEDVARLKAMASLAQGLVSSRAVAPGQHTGYNGVARDERC